MSSISDDIGEIVKYELAKVEGVNEVQVQTVPFVMSVHTRVKRENGPALDILFATEKELRKRFPAVTFDFSCIYEDEQK